MTGRAMDERSAPRVADRRPTVHMGRSMRTTIFLACLSMCIGCETGSGLDAGFDGAAVADAPLLDTSPDDAGELDASDAPIAVDVPPDVPIALPDAPDPLDAPDASIAEDAGTLCEPGDDCVPDALLGGPRTAHAECSGSATFYSACASGCCSTTSSLSALGVSLDFEFVDDAEGRRLHVTAVTVDGGSPQARDAWSPPGSGASFTIDPFSARLTGTFSGPLTTSHPLDGFQLRFRGAMTGPDGTCPGTRTTRTCVFRVD